MTNLQAAVGLAQFEKIEKHLKIKRKIGNYYLKTLIIFNQSFYRQKKQFTQLIFFGYLVY